MAVGVNIISSFDSKGIRKAIDDFGRLDKTSQKFEYGLRTLDKGLTTALTSLVKYGAAAGAAAGVIGYQLVQAASALEESQSKVGVVFKNSADEVRKFAEQSATSIGISEQKALEAAGTYGNLLQAFGLTGDQAKQMSLDFVQLAADLASFNNTSIDDALQALRSGLSGETEPLKRFGVALNDVRLKQEALNLGLYDGKGQLDVAAKAQASYALIMKDTSLAQGDFARTSSGAANQQRILIASFQDVAADLGTALMPAFKNMVSFLNDKVLPIAQRFADAVGERGMAGGLSVLADVFFDVTGSGNNFVDFIIAFTAAFAALKLVLMAATIAQNLFNVSLFANPIGIVVAAVIALGVALVALYIRFEGVRKVVHAVVNAVIAAWEWMTNMIIKGINLAIKAIKALGPLLKFIGIDVSGLGELGEVQFGRIGDAAKKATKDVNKFGNAVEEARFAAIGKRIETNNGEEPDPTGGGGGGAVETARQKLDKYINALKGASDAERGLQDATRSRLNAMASLTAATENVRKAQENFNRVTQGYPRDSKEAVAAMRQVEDASRRLRDAKLSEQDAIRAVAAAEKRLNDLRNKTIDPETVADAERKLEKSKYGVEEANFRVQEAEKELAELRLKPDASAVDIRRAEIALATAKMDVFDSVQSVRDAEKQLAEVRKVPPNPEDLAEAERELERAKNAVSDATLGVRDATVELAVANAFQTQILEGAKEGSDAYKEALTALEEAQQKEREASEAITDALLRERDATLALRDAKLALREAEAKTPPALVKRAEDILASAMPSTAPALEKAVEKVAQGAEQFWSGIGIGGGGIGGLLNEMTLFAKGGIVTKPTLGMVGEAGPEAIIPLSQLGQGGATVNVTVNAGMGTDGQEVARQIIDVLKRYERANGYVPITSEASAF